MDYKLKNCPFCDSANSNIQGGVCFNIKCLDCHAKILGGEREEAIEIWNTRPIAEELQRKADLCDEAQKLLNEAIEQTGHIDYLLAGKLRTLGFQNRVKQLIKKMEK